MTVQIVHFKHNYFLNIRNFENWFFQLHRKLFIQVQWLYKLHTKSVLCLLPARSRLSLLSNYFISIMKLVPETLTVQTIHFKCKYFWISGTWRTGYFNCTVQFVQHVFCYFISTYFDWKPTKCKSNSNSLTYF